MKKHSIFISLLTMSFQSYGQDSSINKIKTWLTEKNFSIRKTFDGSKNENKPAGMLFWIDHQSKNDFFNVDLAIKISEFELLKNKHSSLIFYPKVEWHKSTDSTDLKNKIDGGINFEFIPFGLKSPNLKPGLVNEGLVIAPWFQGTSSFKQNLLDKVFETKLTLQTSFASNYSWLPGWQMRDGNLNFRFRYYPYFGAEYNRLPNLITKGVSEEFYCYFIRLFAELWIVPRTLQLNIDGTYRQIINNKSSIKTWLPIINPSLYFYPGKQETIGIGYEYKNGYDTDAKFQLVQLSKLTFNIKI
ncbi:hypothetical protein [Pinibacter soli]|uniref:Uncharacterized protein n=1 Tax=Pinibacter soli TaxID=3044211 RepID=A0ABT6RHE1_9BACT|nr:hypothetical protein [Pinibacter soli]MDI3321998.1 hypothetical protein [Pinibacter soli]